MKDKGNKAVSRARKPSLFARVAALIEEARQKVATVANLAQVYTNFEIGRQIVEEEQGGKRRLVYAFPRNDSEVLSPIRANSANGVYGICGQRFSQRC